MTSRTNVYLGVVCAIALGAAGAVQIAQAKLPTGPGNPGQMACGVGFKNGGIQSGYSCTTPLLTCVPTPLGANYTVQMENAKATLTGAGVVFSYNCVRLPILK